MLTKNTITIQYLKVLKNESGQYYFPQKPLSSSRFKIYVDPKVRKQLDIGSIVKTTAHTNHQLIYAVIVDNDTEFKSQQHHPTLSQTQIYPNGHLRTFLSAKYNIKRDSKIANHVYHSFRTCSHAYWAKLYATPAK